MAAYRKRHNRNGLPLGSREHYTKLDWLIWSACLMENQDDFKSLIAPIASWLDDAPQRVPLWDWFYTTIGRQIGVGGSAPSRS